MKTIALAANGEGFGHASRMVSLAQGLMDSYRLVLYVPKTIAGFVADKLGPGLGPAIKLVEIPGLLFAKKGDRILYFRTLKSNGPVIVSLPFRLATIRTSLRSERVDALVSDFEPLSTWAAKALGIPVLQVNHPGIVLRSPSVSPDALAAKAVAALMMGIYDRRLLISFYNGDVGPVVRKSISSLKPASGSVVVVNVKAEYRRRVLDTLARLGVGDVAIYPDSAPAVSYEDALAGCRAVISSAGHQTLSEAICLGKPVFAIPQRGQYEQRLNAQMLDVCGFGAWSGLKDLEANLARFFAEAAAGGFVGKPKGLKVKALARDCSDELLRRVVNFVEYKGATRIVMMDQAGLDRWLEKSAATDWRERRLP